MDGFLFDPRRIITKLHVKRGHASARQLKRVLVDLDGQNMHLADSVDEVSERCEVCRSCDKAPHVPIAGTTAVSMSDGNV